MAESLDNHQIKEILLSPSHKDLLLDFICQIIFSTLNDRRYSIFYIKFALKLFYVKEILILFIGFKIENKNKMLLWNLFSCYLGNPNGPVYWWSETRLKKPCLWSKLSSSHVTLPLFIFLYYGIAKCIREITRGSIIDSWNSPSAHLQLFGQEKY